MTRLEITTKRNFSVNNSNEGESIESKFERMLANGEGIKDGAPIIYTERKDGVKAAYNIRSDRFDIALDGINATQKSQTARREEKARKLTEEESSKNESIQGTE